MANILLFLNGLSVGSVLSYALNAVLTACLGLVSLGSSDDLTVASLEAEAVFARFVGVHFELGAGCSNCGINGLILEVCNRSVLLYALDALEAACFCIVNLGSSDDLSVGCNEVELNAGCCFSYFEFSHCDILRFCRQLAQDIA